MICFDLPTIHVRNVRNGGHRVERQTDRLYKSGNDPITLAQHRVYIGHEEACVFQYQKDPDIEYDRQGKDPALLFSILLLQRFARASFQPGNGLFLLPRKLLDPQTRPIDAECRQYDKQTALTTEIEDETQVHQKQHVSADALGHDLIA